MEKKLEATNLGFRVWRLGGVGSWDLGFGDLGFWGAAFWGEGCRDPRKLVLTILQETLGILVHDRCNLFLPRNTPDYQGLYEGLGLRVRDHCIFAPCSRV